MKTLFKKIVKIKILPYILLFVASLITLYVISFVFTIKQIRVHGVEEIKGLSQYYDRYIFKIDPIEAEKQLYVQNASLKSIKVEKEYPDSIDIYVVENRAVGELLIANGYLSLSGSGRVLSKQRNAHEDLSLAQIKYYQPLHFNQFSSGEGINNSEIEASLLFIDGLQDLGIEVETVDINNENMIVLLAGEREYRITSTKDVNQQIEELKVLLERLIVQDDDYNRIDLRFEKPIVTFK